MKNSRNLDFWLTLILLLATAISSIVAYIFWYSLLFFVGSYLFIHWLGLIATIFVVVSTPIHYILKRKRPQNSKRILKFHVFGNLLAFLVISLHVAQNIGRLSGAFERLGEGFALYLLLTLIVASGVVERFQTSGKLRRYIKAIHKYAVIALIVVMIIHVLDGFNFL